MSLCKINRKFIYSNEYDRYVASVKYFNKTINGLFNGFISDMTNDLLPYIVNNHLYAVSNDDVKNTLFNNNQKIINNNLLSLFENAFNNIIKGQNKHNNMKLIIGSENHFFDEDKFDDELNGIYKYMQNNHQSNSYFGDNIMCLINIINSIATGNYKVLTHNLIKYSNLENLTLSEVGILTIIVSAYVQYHINNCLINDEDVIKNIKQIKYTKTRINNILQIKYDFELALNYYDILDDETIISKIRDKIAEYSKLSKIMSKVKLDNDECCVCYHDTIQVKFKCKHSVCGECYAVLKSKQSKCPICRQTVFANPRYYPTSYSNTYNNYLSGSYYQRINNNFYLGNNTRYST
jgi:hypothetical protein